jgi:hypothetical protein
LQPCSGEQTRPVEGADVDEARIRADAIPKAIELDPGRQGVIVRVEVPVRLEQSVEIGSP